VQAHENAKQKKREREREEEEEEAARRETMKAPLVWCG
jgi:hypothetical protein